MANGTAGYGIALGKGAILPPDNDHRSFLSGIADERIRQRRLGEQKQAANQKEIDDLMKHMKVDYSKWTIPYADEAAKVTASLVNDYLNVRNSSNSVALGEFQKKVYTEYQPRINELYNGNLEAREWLKTASDPKSPFLADNQELAKVLSDPKSNLNSFLEVAKKYPNQGYQVSENGGFTFARMKKYEPDLYFGQLREGDYSEEKMNVPPVYTGVPGSYIVPFRKSLNEDVVTALKLTLPEDIGIRNTIQYYDAQAANDPDLMNEKAVREAEKEIALRRYKGIDARILKADRPRQFETEEKVQTITPSSNTTIGVKVPIYNKSNMQPVYLKDKDGEDKYFKADASGNTVPATKDEEDAQRIQEKAKSEITVRKSYPILITTSEGNTKPLSLQTAPSEEMNMETGREEKVVGSKSYNIDTVAELPYIESKEGKRILVTDKARKEKPELFKNVKYDWYAIGKETRTGLEDGREIVIPKAIRYTPDLEQRLQGVIKLEGFERNAETKKAEPKAESKSEVPTIDSQEAYDQLKSGDQYYDTSGKLRRKK